MQKVKLSFKNRYTKKDGTAVYVYLVSGEEASVAAYKNAQGANLREDEATQSPLYFTTTPVLEGSELVITANGKIATATDLEKEVNRNEALEFEAAVRMRVEALKARKNPAPQAAA